MSIQEPAPPTDLRRPRRRSLLVLQVVYGLFVVPWFALAIAATMGLANTDFPWSAPGILFTWLYPVAVLVACVGSHAVWSRSPRAAHRWNLVALPWVVVGVGLLAWIFSDGFSFGP